MFEPIHEAWNVRHEEFPTDGTPTEQLRFCLHYAMLAPSLQNTQPWRFKLWKDEVALYVDSRRRFFYIDPENRQSIISCGAALFNLRVALRYFGYAGDITEMPDTTDPDLLAIVGLGQAKRLPRSDRKLFKSMANRHTNRRPFVAQQVSTEIVRALQAAAKQEGIWLQEVREGPMREALAKLIGEGDEVELADPRFRREMAAGLQQRDEQRTDGIPYKSQNMPGLISWVGPYRVRMFDTGALYAAREQQLAVNSPLLVVLGTPTDTHHNWLRTGQALAHVLLLATSWDVDASFLNSPIEVQELRPRVAEAVGRSGYPQLILRLGYGEETKPTPRRALEEVVI